MIEVYVLDKNLNMIYIIDSYKSLIWANRYKDVGDCELYVSASTEALNALQKGNYLIRTDDDMVCQIKKVELITDAENGNYIIVTGLDCKRFLDQRIMWGTRYCDGNVEDFIRQFVNEALGNPTLSARQLRKANGQRLFYLGNKANFTEVLQQQMSYANIGEKVRELCTNYGWGYKVVMSSGALYFLLYKGTDRSSDVSFSNDFENLVATKYIDDDTNLGNVAIVAGEGEGSKRTRNVSGYAEGLNRYEIYVDARDLSKAVTWKDLTDLYPTREQGGVGSIQRVTNPDQSFYYVYEMDYVDIAIVDDNQYTELVAKFPNGTRRVVDGNVYYRVYSVAIADLPSNTLENSDTVTLRDIIYSVYLLTRGYEKLSEYGSVTTFDGSIEPNTTFTYKQDYFLGDLVNVQNEFGITVNARITEIIEICDDEGYRIEPKFKYAEIEEPDPQVLGALLAENSLMMMTETAAPMLMESAPASSEGVKISELEAADTLYDGCCFPIVQNGETKKVTFENVKTLLKDDNVVLIDKAQFNAEAYAEAFDNDLNIYVTENFDDVSGLDLTDTTTRTIVEECYDAHRMCLNYDSSQTATLKAKQVTLQDEPKYFWIRVEWEGSGSLQINIDFVGKKKYTDWKNGECKYLVVGQRGKTIGADIILTGEVTLKNVAWGVK